MHEAAESACKLPAGLRDVQPSVSAQKFSAQPQA